jgi:hypothetical protein
VGVADIIPKFRKKYGSIMEFILPVYVGGGEQN